MTNEPTHTCERCKKPFTARRNDARYCGGSCRVMAHAARQKAEGAEAMKLLRAQTAALASGADPAILAEIQRQAESFIRRVTK